MESMALSQLSALSHGQRLAVFRLLVRRYPTDVAAGEISQALGFKPNTTSVYLASLKDAGLIQQRRSGTSLLYKADLNAAHGLMSFLTSDCCRDRVTAGLGTDAKCPVPSTNDKERLNILFVCSGNSARSICAEAVLRDLGGCTFNAYSAGTSPAHHPKKAVLEHLAAQGHDVSSLTSKGIAEFQSCDAPKMDVVITLCDRAANEDCPPWNGHPVNSHWSVPDPNRNTPSPHDQKLQIGEMYTDLKAKIEKLRRIGASGLTRHELQSVVDSIALYSSEGALS